MATLTPLSKGLIGLAVVGAVASAFWHLGLKDWVADGTFSKPSSSITVTAPPPSNAVVATPATTAASSPAQNPASVVSPSPQPVENRPAKSPTTPAPAASNPAAASAGNNRSPADNGEIGRKFLDNGDFAQARIYLEQAVQGGDGASACRLGEMTLKGQGGIPADQEKAARLFLIAQSKNIICFAMGK